MTDAHVLPRMRVLDPDPPDIREIRIAGYLGTGSTAIRWGAQDAKASISARSLVNTIETESALLAKETTMASTPEGLLVLADF